jgi:hypothetical protein
VHGVPAGRGSPPHPGSEEEAGHMSRLPCRRGSSSPLPPPRPLVLIDPLFFINFLDMSLSAPGSLVVTLLHAAGAHTHLRIRAFPVCTATQFCRLCSDMCMFDLLTVSHTASQGVTGSISCVCQSIILKKIKGLRQGASCGNPSAWMRLRFFTAPVQASRGNGASR